MDDAAALFLSIISILLSVLLGVLYAYLHSINEKISNIKIDIVEMKGLIMNIKRK
jgi:hypothetical protein